MSYMSDRLIAVLTRLFLNQTNLASERQIILANFLSRLSSIHEQKQQRMIDQNDQIITLLRTIAGQRGDTGGT